ncbi:MAG: hypothetical protein NZ866_02310, partial [Patescibacteria group bacterium]|nr:hypothetical protein [Patescibacteria group bacterium]
MKKNYYKKSLEILADFINCQFNLSNFRKLLNLVKNVLTKNKIKVLKIHYHLFDKNNGATII